MAKLSYKLTSPAVSLLICISLHLSQQQHVYIDSLITYIHKYIYNNIIGRIFIFTRSTTKQSKLLRYHQRLSFGHDKNLWNINTLCLLFLSLYLGCATRAQPNKGLPRWTEAAFRGGECEGFSRAFSSGLLLTTLLLGSSRGADGLASPRQPSVSLPPRFVIRSKTSC